jgi:hypothetical protein
MITDKDLEPSQSWKTVYPLIDKIVSDWLDNQPIGSTFTSSQIMNAVAPGIGKAAKARFYKGLFASAEHGVLKHYHLRGDPEMSPYGKLGRSYIWYGPEE